jgi:hypothetical protein
MKISMAENDGRIQIKEGLRELAQILLKITRLEVTGGRSDLKDVRVAFVWSDCQTPPFFLNFSKS